MSNNQVSVFESAKGVTYHLHDNTVAMGYDCVRYLYSFAVVSQYPEPEVIEDTDGAVSAALIAADSFKDAITWLEQEFKVGPKGTVYNVEYIGTDLRPREANTGLFIELNLV